MNVGVAILAYGEEHITETNSLIDDFLTKSNEVTLYIATDSPDLITKHDKVKTFLIKEEFNYNLKRIAFEYALMHHDYVILSDSDIHIINNIDFSFLDVIEDGMYVNWASVINKFVVLKSEQEEEYINVIRNNVEQHQKLYFINESTVLFKITDINQKIDLLESWNYYYDRTKHSQPTYDKVGAVEGVLIHAACVKSGLKMHNIDNDRRLDIFFKNFLHYKRYHNTPKVNKKLVI
jgi:hypothetical protein